MTIEELVPLLQYDLANEVQHMMFYLRAATEVQGFHREEFREFFIKEAKEEMGHVLEFSDMISYLGGVPFQHATVNWRWGSNPRDILEEVVRMEQEVAANYANRLKQTESPHMEDYHPAIATAHVFYEDQIKNSQMTAWEVQKWLKKHNIQ
jgi:bacterioferritin